MNFLYMQEENKEQKIEVKEEKKDSWLDLLKFGFIVLVIVIPFRIFIAQPYIVEGSSMDPTFKDGDYLIVDQISYKFEQPARGAVIILKYPKDTSKDFIKRVIGFPGETVIIRNGEVSVKLASSTTEINLDEPYIKYPKIENYQYTLKEGEYFVMGDNRAGSSDSRIWGPLPADDIVGRPILRLFPLSSISTMPGFQNPEK